MNQRGALVARVLTGAWREDPPSFDGTAAELVAATPHLFDAHVAALGWWRIRRSALADTTAGAELHNAFRQHAIWATLHQRALAGLVSRLRTGGVEPIIVKGWVAARQYPTSGLRAYLDHDICVRRADSARSRAILASGPDRTSVVDLHDGFATLDDSPEDELFARSSLVDCDTTSIRVLSPEDHLRVLCRHAMRHGFARPVWLCDVAVAVETRSAAFDWARCLGPRARGAAWVTRTLQIAQAVLGMTSEGTPAADLRSPLPRWVLPTVLRAWDQAPAPKARMATALQRPSTILREMRQHWPNGLQATFAVGGPINNLPRWPFQAAVPGRPAHRPAPRIKDHAQHADRSPAGDERAARRPAVTSPPTDTRVELLLRDLAPSAGLELLKPLDADERLAGHHRLEAVRAHLLEMTGDLQGAARHYRAAASRTTSIPERDYLLTQAAKHVKL